MGAARAQRGVAGRARVLRRIGSYGVGDAAAFFGFYATGYYFWGPLHALSAKVLLAALLVHIVLRTPAAASVLRRELARENER